jgi:hypothetical protein
VTFFPPPSRQAPGVDPRGFFAREAEAVVRECLDLSEVHHDPARFALIFTTGTGEKCFSLLNVFNETRDLLPEKRRERIAFFARASEEHEDATESAWPVAAPRLVPLLRPVSVESALLMANTGGRSPNLASRPFLPFLRACLAMDNPSSTTFVRTDTLAGWNVSLDTALGRAVENFTRLEANHSVESYDPSVAYPIWHVTANDSYEASRLLLPGWLAAFNGNVRGRPVAIVPERGQLIVAGDGDDDAIDRLLRTADREFIASPRRISPGLYTVDRSGRVVPYFSCASHALAARTRLAHLKLALHEYELQIPALQEQIKAKGLDLCVASYQALDTDAIGPLSVTMWIKGGDSLLPITDFVALDRKDGSPSRLVPWAAVTAYAWAHLQPWGSDPPRMRTLGWPDDTVLRQLEAHTVKHQTG